MKITKLCFVVMMFLAIAAPIVLQVPEAYSTELSAKEKSLSFMNQVIGLDMTKYAITKENTNVIYPPSLKGMAQEEIVRVLEVDGNKLEVACSFRNGNLYNYNQRVLSGSVLYAQPSSLNVLDTAKSLLQKYQSYSDASYIQPMMDILNSITELQPTTVATDNIKFSMNFTNGIVQIKWMYTFAGLDNAWKIVGFTFKDGFLRAFGDGWNVYQIGSTDVKVSEESAVNIATELSKNYRLQMYAGPNCSLIDVPFNITADRTKANLSIQSREPLVLYPFWHVQIYFDKLYYSAYGIEVGIWADTGEIEFCQATGIAGDIANVEDPASSSSPSLTQTPTASPNPSPNPASNLTIASTPEPIAQSINPISGTSIDSSQPELTPSPILQLKDKNDVTLNIVIGAIVLLVAVALAVIIANKRSK